MPVPFVDNTTFQALLVSAKLGSWVNVSGAQFKLSAEQLEKLLTESQKTPKGKVSTRGEDFNPIVLAHLMLNYGHNLDIVWTTPTQLR